MFAHASPDALASATHRFQETFGRRPRFAAAAPGRVNLIGEHTDYNDGFVLPLAIEGQTLIVANRAAGRVPLAAGPPVYLPSGLNTGGQATSGAQMESSADRTVRVISAGQVEQAAFNVDRSLAPGEPRWANYVRGVVAGCLAAGLDPGGFDAVIDSTVPVGGGLSSSAALEVATATLIEALTGQTLDPIAKALLCQKAEHDFAGVPCGIMDQFISTLAQTGHAMLLDCRSHQTRMVPLNDPGITVLIANTNVRHELTGGEYAQRRLQCEQAARALCPPAQGATGGLTAQGARVPLAARPPVPVSPGLSQGATGGSSASARAVGSEHGRTSRPWRPTLRDVSMAELQAQEARLDPMEFRRARHVVSEIARTLQAADDMAAARWSAVGKLMYASHESLRNDFEVSCPELDLMVELARTISEPGGVYGSRMTGGGFGGCTVSLIRSDRAEAIRSRLHEQYQARTGIEPTIFVTRPGPGARIIAL